MKYFTGKSGGRLYFAGQLKNLRLLGKPFSWKHNKLIII